MAAEMASKVVHRGSADDALRMASARYFRYPKCVCGALQREMLRSPVASLRAGAANTVDRPFFNHRLSVQ
jgi:hypothetical protein